jgi:fucose permease
MNYSRGRVFTAGCSVIFIFGISIITLGATLPQLSADFGLSEIDKGTLASMLPIGILIGSLIFGPIVDKYSYKYFLAVNILLIICGFLTITFANSLLHLSIAFLLIGTGGGSLNGASSSLVSDFSDDFNENKGANLSILGTFFGLGALGMPILLNLLSGWFGYREIIGGVGILMLIPVVFILSISYPLAKQSSAISLNKIFDLLKNGMLIMLAMILFFQSGWESLINNWITTYLIEVKTFSGSTALALLTFFSAVFTAGRFTVGLLLKKISAQKILLLLSFVALVGCIILFFTSSLIHISIALALVGFGLAAAFPIVLGFVGDRFAQWSGTAFGIVLTVALLGNMLLNYLTGLMTETYGISTYAWAVIFAGSCTTVLIIFGVRWRKVD